MPSNVPSDEELFHAADELDASSDEVERVLRQRRASVAALKHLLRVGGKLLEVAEQVAIQAAIAAIQGAVTRG